MRLDLSDAAEFGRRTDREGLGGAQESLMRANRTGGSIVQRGRRLRLGGDDRGEGGRARGAPVIVCRRTLGHNHEARTGTCMEMYEERICKYNPRGEWEGKEREDGKGETRVEEILKLD